MMNKYLPGNESDLTVIASFCDSSSVTNCTSPFIAFLLSFFFDLVWLAQDESMRRCCRTYNLLPDRSTGFKLERISVREKRLRNEMKWKMQFLMRRQGKRKNWLLICSFEVLSEFDVWELERRSRATKVHPTRDNENAINVAWLRWHKFFI